MPAQVVRMSIRVAVLMFVASQAVSVWAVPPGDPSASPSSTATSQPASATQPAIAVPAAAAPVLAELLALKQSIDAQTRQIANQSNQLDSERASIAQELQQFAALEAKLGVTSSAAASQSAAAIDAEPSFSIPPQRVPQSASQVRTPQDLSDRAANLEQQLKTFGPFTFSGDIRLRDEPSFGGPANRSLDQNRARFRLRLNIDAKLNDDFSGGFSLASGDLNNPISDNQTIGDFYARKPIAIDKAFVTYSPHQFHALTLIGGKFAYPWYNTELVWDKDLNPEGAAETLAFDLKSAAVLKRVGLVGFELPFTQVAGVSLNNKSLATSAVYGGQLQTTWQLAHWLKFGAFTAFCNYHNADPIAFAVATASAKNPQTPLTGLLPLVGNTVQNSILTTKAIDVVTIGGTAYPTGITNIANAQFASKFGLFDSLATFDVATPWQRWPVKLIGDYVQNTKACANLNNLHPAPANTASVEYSQSANLACNPHERRGYWGEIRLGAAKKRGDWEFDYARIFIEREAVVSNFNYSEILQGSNVSEHRAMIVYQVHRNVQLSYTALIGRPLNFGSTAPPEPWLDRMQFDVLYNF